MMRKISKYINRRITGLSVKLNNIIVDLSRNNSKRVYSSGIKELDEIRRKSLIRTDINEHLDTLFVESLIVRPKLIVELGVRGGESTYVFERVARLTNSKLISVDIDDCSNLSSYKGWKFIKSDDIKFANSFAVWCKKQRINPSIDVLFIDTSHLFEHTLKEIENWFPFLSSRARVFFHDTNMGEVYTRRDGSKGFGWDNERGVIRAIERYLGAQLIETSDFIAYRKKLMIKHYAHCNGLTILERVKW